MEGVCYDEDGATVTTGSGLHGHLLLEEPSQLKQDRIAAAVSLADLLQAVLWVDGPDPSLPAGTLPSHLLQIFGEDQLPGVAAYHKARTSGHAEEQALRSRMQGIGEWLKNPDVMDAYLSWVQATLLQVINEVLSQHMC
jgi:hypothetical protein